MSRGYFFIRLLWFRTIFARSCGPYWLICSFLLFCCPASVPGERWPIINSIRTTSPASCASTGINPNCTATVSATWRKSSKPSRTVRIRKRPSGCKPYPRSSYFARVVFRLRSIQRSIFSLPRNRLRIPTGFARPRLMGYFGHPAPDVPTGPMAPVFSFLQLTFLVGSGALSC